MHFIKDRGFGPRCGDAITPRALYAGRRAFLKQLAGGSAGAALALWACARGAGADARAGQAAAAARRARARSAAR